MHVYDITGTAQKDVAEPLLKHLDGKVGQCKADCGSCLHTGIQHEHSPLSVFTHQCVYIDSFTPIGSGLFNRKDEEVECD